MNDSIPDIHPLRSEEGRKAEYIKGIEEIVHFLSSSMTSLDDFSAATIEIISRCTDSPAALFGLISRDEETLEVLNWSPGIMAQCAIPAPPLSFSLSSTGIASEVVRTRAPLLLNDYAAQPTREGLPAGHIPLTRILAVPVFRDTQLVALAMVANKKTPYDPEDMAQLSLVANALYGRLRLYRLMEKIRASEEKYRILFEAESDAIALIDVETLRLKDVNKSMEELYGYNHEELLALKCTDLSAEPDKTEEKVTTLDGQFFIPLRYHRKKSGEIFPVEIAARFFELLGERMLLVAMRDISKRKEIEDQLCNAKDRLEKACLAGNVALWEWNLASNDLQWSGSIDLMLGYDPDEFPRTFVAWEKIIHPDDYERCMQALKGHLLEGAPYEIDYRVRRHDGEYRPWHVVGTVLRDSGLMIGSCTDITALHRAEESMREMQIQLLQQEKLAQIGQLAAGVAHEINNPMGFVASNLTTLGSYVRKFTSYIAMLERMVPDENAAEIAAARAALKLDYLLKDAPCLITESCEGAERVKRIVQDLNSFSRVDTSVVVPTDINHSLDGTINIVWNKIKYVAKLIRDYGELPPVHCNAQRINQAFMNLLMNAIQAIQEKGEAHEGLISLRTWHEGQDVYISISDNGSGISPEHLAHIYDAFFTTKEVGKGTGLGLSITAEIIRKHGGEITVASRAGEGANFTIRLPIGNGANCC